jgi:chaperonin GroES
MPAVEARAAARLALSNSIRSLIQSCVQLLSAQEDYMAATATKTKSKSKVTLQPIGDKVVVERDESEERTAGGIVLPDTAKDKPTRGTIIAVGTGKLLDDGSRGEMQVKKGDRVLFTSYAPETINIGEDEYLLMSESDILAVIE